MEYRKLGNTDLSVSRVGFGGWGISGVYYLSGACRPTGADRPAGAGALSPKQVKETLDLSIDAGINLFDTSSDYGLSEIYLGRWMRQRGIRDKIVLSTKCGLAENKMRPLSRSNMEKSLSASLNRLNTDWIDIYAITSVNSVKQWEGALETLEAFRKRGAVRYTAVSANNMEELRWAVECPLIDVVYFPFNLFDVEKMTWLMKKPSSGKGLIVKSPLNKGILSGKYSGDSVFAEDDVRSVFLKKETLDKRMRWIQAFKKEFGIDQRQLLETAVRFILAYKGVDSVLFSFKSPGQVEEVLRIAGRGGIEQEAAERIAAFSIANQKMLDEYFYPEAEGEKKDAEEPYNVTPGICKVTPSKRADPINLYHHPSYKNRDFHNLRRMPRFPIIIIVNVSSYCNFKCKMCPRNDKFPRRQVTGLGNGNMSLELFKKIAGEGSKYPEFVGYLFALFGEPLMNKEIARFVRYAKASGKKVQVVTNGSLLTEEKMEALIDAGLDKIKVSFQGATPEEYKFWRGYEYERIKSNVLRLIEMRNKKGDDLYIQVGTTVSRDTEEQIRDWVAFWRGRVDNVYVDVTGLTPSRRCGELENYVPRYETVIRKELCDDIFTRLSVMHNGKASLCMHDEEEFIGDLTYQSVAEVWNSELRVNQRRMFLEKGNCFPICKYCFTSPRIVPGT